MGKHFKIALGISLLAISCSTSSRIKRVKRQLESCKKINVHQDDVAVLKGVYESVSRIVYDFSSNDPVSRSTSRESDFGEFEGSAINIGPLVKNGDYRISITFDSTHLLPSIVPVSIHSYSNPEDSLLAIFIEPPGDSISFTYRATGYETHIYFIFRLYSTQEVSKKSEYGLTKADSLELYNSWISKFHKSMEIKEYMRINQIKTADQLSDSIRSAISSLSWKVYLNRVQFELLHADSICGQISIDYELNTP